MNNLFLIKMVVVFVFIFFLFRLRRNDNCCFKFVIKKWVKNYFKICDILVCIVIFKGLYYKNILKDLIFVWFELRICLKFLC